MLAQQREVLRSSHGFRLLFGSTLISGLGTWLAVVALTLDVAARTHQSGWWVAALLVADFLPGVAIGLTLGPLVDRLSRKRLLVAADLARLAAFVALVFATRPWHIVALAFVAGVASGFARPAAYAGLPNLVSAEMLPRANSLLRTADQLTIMVGTLLGGAAVTGGISPRGSSSSAAPARWPRCSSAGTSPCSRSRWSTSPRSSWPPCPTTPARSATGCSGPPPAWEL